MVYTKENNGLYKGKQWFIQKKTIEYKIGWVTYK